MDMGGTIKKAPSLQGLLWAQFTEAFSDNAWKLVLFSLATRSLLSTETDWSDAASQASQVTASLTILTFLIPMLLFALPAGAIADRFSKRSIILAMKGVGVFLMAAATIILFISPENLWIPFIILGLMGAQSATFNPAKYGILPEMLPMERLSPANGTVQMVTMLAIISGTGLGPILLYFDQAGARPWLTFTAPLFLTIMALGAFLAALTIPKVAAAAKARDKSDKNSQTPAHGILRSAWQAIRCDKTLSMAILGTALFWTMTSLTGQNLLVYSQSLVHGLEHGELWQGVPTAAFGVGIALGAFFSGTTSAERIEPGLICLGALLFATMSLGVGVFQPQMAGTVFLLIFLGGGAGMLIVPLQALMQSHAPADKRGAILAISNTCDIVGLTIGSLVAVGLSLLGLSLQMILILSSLLAVSLALWSVYLIPGPLVQAFFLVLVKSKIIRPSLSAPLPQAGTMTSTSLSLYDLLVLRALLRRPIVAVIPRNSFRRRWLSPFAKALQIHCEGEKLMDSSPPALTLYLNSSTPDILGNCGAENSAPLIFLQRPRKRLHSPYYEMIQ